MKHYTNKNTLKVFGYESEEIAKEYNNDYENLVLMSDELFEEYKNKPLGATWSINGWIVDEELAQAERNAIKEAENTSFLSSEINRTETKLTQLYRLRDRNKASEIHLSQIEELEDYSTDLMLVEDQEGYPLNADFPTCPDFFSE